MGKSSEEEVNLEAIGKYIGKFLTVYTVVGVIFIMLKYFFHCFNKVCPSDYASGILLYLILFGIPTEVSIVEIFSKFSLLLVIALIFYWIYIKPHEK